MKVRTLAAAIVVLALATGGAGAADDEMAPGDVARWLAFFDRLVEVVVETQAACDRMAVGVDRLVDASQDAIEVARDARAQGKRLPPPAQQRMRDGLAKMTPGMRRCNRHDGVRAAFARLDLDRRR